jgi:uncharacterized RDD family membrane protein YckC
MGSPRATAMGGPAGRSPPVKKMSTADAYVNTVLDRLPRTMARRAQIGIELRGHIAERVAAGHAVDDVLQQLGDPGVLAESYLSAIPLVAAPLGKRIVAKLIDLTLFFIVFAILIIGAVIIATMSGGNYEQLWMTAWFAFIASLILGSILFGIYNVVTEWHFGYTAGKRLLGLRVVRESGARIGLGQSIVRQLPAVLQIYWIDALFALFTDKKQRAFELLSKTRVVVGEQE